MRITRYNCALDYYNVGSVNLSLPTWFRPYYRIILRFIIQYKIFTYHRAANKIGSQYNSILYSMYRHRLKCWHSALVLGSQFSLSSQVTFNQLHTQALYERTRNSQNISWITRQERRYRQVRNSWAPFALVDASAPNTFPIKCAFPHRYVHTPDDNENAVRVVHTTMPMPEMYRTCSQWQEILWYGITCMPCSPYIQTQNGCHGRHVWQWELSYVVTLIYYLYSILPLSIYDNIYIYLY